VKTFDAGKTRMIGLPYGEKNYDDMLSHFHLIPERHGRTDRRTELLYQYRASVCWRAIKTEHKFTTETARRPNNVRSVRLTTVIGESGFKIPKSAKQKH